MEVIPAIDLRGGAVVRLEQGDFSRETVYGHDAGVVARRWVEEGAQRIHVVNLEGAARRDSSAVGMLGSVLASVACDTVVEVGGGVRTMDELRALLDMDGRLRAVLGTAAVLAAVQGDVDVEALLREAGRERAQEFPEEDLLASALAGYGARVSVGVDARGGKTAVCGWSVLVPVSPVKVGRRLGEAGVCELIYTDVLGDGMLRGHSMDRLGAFADGVGTDVVASGGIGSLDDVRTISGLASRGITGMILGRALYEERFALSEAISAAAAGGCDDDRD